MLWRGHYKEYNTFRNKFIVVTLFNHWAEFLQVFFFLIWAEIHSAPSPGWGDNEYFYTIIEMFILPWRS